MSQAPEGGPLGVFGWLLSGSIALVALTIILLIGILLVGGTATDLGATDDPFNTTASPNSEVGTAISFASTEGEREVLAVYDVNDSTGYAVEFTGASDSYLESDQQVDIGDDSWTVSTWARVDDGAKNNLMTAVSADGRVLIQYLNGTWSAWYYDEADRNSWRANVSAPDQPGNLSLVTATSNGTHLWIYANTTRGDTVNITGSSIEDATLNSTNWDGSLDETRTFDDETNDSEQSTHYNNPVAPRDERNRTARITYDEGSGQSTAIYFTGVSASLSNFSWVSTGLPGNRLSEGTDYQLSEADGTITAIDGGLIDGAPVVWIDYRYQPISNVGQVSEALQGAFDLFSNVPLIIPAVAVLSVLIGGIIGAIKLADVGQIAPRKGQR